MSGDLQEAGYIMRLGVMAFVLPIWALVTGFFIWEQMYVYAFLMTLFGALMVYGSYKNFDRLRREDKVDDERMRKVNRKAGSSAFWTVMHISIFSGIFQGFFSQEPMWVQYNAAAIIGIGFAAYLCFRFYYLKYGTEADFWNLR